MHTQYLISAPELLAVDFSCGPPNIQSLLVIISRTLILCWVPIHLGLKKIDDAYVFWLSLQPVVM